MPPSSSSRIAWIDNLRTLMIVLVMNMHACVTCSHVGSLYRIEDPEPRMPAKIEFMFWQGFLQAFFMGLLFFLAGVFAHRSLARRSPNAFLHERVTRLGFPSLLFMMLFEPFMLYVLLGYSHVPDRPSLVVLYGRYITSGKILSGSGPMQFALALLFFCAVLAGVRFWKPKKAPATNPSSAAPGTSAMLGFGALLVLSTVLIRLVQPIGTNVLNFQLCFFPQYIAAFPVGVAAGKHGWLEELATSRRARISDWLGGLGGPLVLKVIAAWEQFAGLGMALGSMAWFHRECNSASRMATWLSERAFAVYLSHAAPVLVALTPLLGPAAVNPFVVAELLTVTGLFASFAIADAVRRLPRLRKILWLIALPMTSGRAPKTVRLGG